MKRFVAGSLTVLVMTLMICTALLRSHTPGPDGEVMEANSILQDSRSKSAGQFKGATACIERLLASARAGDVNAYLTTFGGALRDRLTREADEVGRDAFAARLRRTTLARKSHAVFAPEADSNLPDTARITVESTFADRIERQTFRLERAANGWLVTDSATAREHVPKTSFGSLATYQEPEGPPVATRSDEPAGDEIED
jgi:hypothetical protein